MSEGALQPGLIVRRGACVARRRQLLHRGCGVAAACREAATHDTRVGKQLCTQEAWIGTADLARLCRSTTAGLCDSPPVHAPTLARRWRAALAGPMLTKGHHRAEGPHAPVGCQEVDAKALPPLGRAKRKRRHRPAAAAAAGRPQAQPPPAGRHEGGSGLRAGKAHCTHSSSLPGRTGAPPVQNDTHPSMLYWSLLFASKRLPKQHPVHKGAASGAGCGTLVTCRAAAAQTSALPGRHAACCTAARCCLCRGGGGKGGSSGHARWQTGALHQSPSGTAWCWQAEAGPAWCAAAGGHGTRRSPCPHAVNSHAAWHAAACTPVAQASVPHRCSTPTPLPIAHR